MTKFFQVRTTLVCLLVGSFSWTAAAQPAGDDAIVEVDGMVRSLPRVVVVPTDEASVPAGQEVAKLISLTGLFTAAAIKPASPAGGLVVRVTTTAEGNGQRVEAVSSKTEGSPHRRSVSMGATNRALEMARLGDAILADLTGERSHLSGTLLYTDAATVGQRRVRTMLATGVALRDISPPDVLAHGADLGPGGVVFFAGARTGEMMQIFAEGRSQPLPVRVSGFLQSVSFSADRLQAAVIAGSQQGGLLYRGLLEGTMTLVNTGPGIALGPVFGPGGELAYATGAPEGPLRVVVDGKPVTPAGMWASAPNFCHRANKRRLAYMVKQGRSWSTSIANLEGGGTTSVGPGAFPACSPDGRTLALVRTGGRDGGGIYLTGEDGIANSRIRAGAASSLRWAPGPSLPPEG